MDDQFNQLVNYVRQHMAQGVTPQDIRASLLQHNWSAEVVDRALAVAHAGQQFQTPPSGNAAPLAETKHRGMFGRRINRRGFGLGLLYIILTVVAWVVILFSSFSLIKSDTIMTLLNLISVIAGIVGVLFVFVVLISLLIRRLHDAGQSGLFALLILLPPVNVLLILYLLLAPGKPGDNSYGPPVKSLGYLVVLGLKRPQAS